MLSFELRRLEIIDGRQGSEPCSGNNLSSLLATERMALENMNSSPNTYASMPLPNPMEKSL